jgi:aminopeptidase N
MKSATPSTQQRTQAGCIAAGPGIRLDSIGDNFYPGLGNAGYDAQRYMLDLSADMPGDTISATVTMQAMALQDLSVFNLDFKGFEISGITVDGGPAQYTRDGSELSITPANPLRSGEGFTTIVSYGGVPKAGSEEASPIKIGWVRYAKGVYVASEPSGAEAWYPVNDHPCDKATYELRITVPRPYVVAANGLLRDTKDNGAERTYVWETEHPVASYLVTVNIGDFVEKKEAGPNGLPMRSYFPRDLESTAQAPFNLMPGMIEYFNGVFGPYPFEAYGVVVVDEDLGFALETQTLSLFGHTVGTSRVTGEEAVAHELVHQWFGDSVSLETWRDIWLNEGFATYGQWLWLEHTKGREALEARIIDMYSAVAQEKPPPPGDPPTNNLFNMGVYIRGGLTLHALRLKIGDDAFFRTLQTYASRYRDDNARTADFIAIAEDVSGQKLGDFFQAWLYEQELPGIPEMGLKP